MEVAGSTVMREPIQPLTADEIQRYKRHLVLRDVGGAGQQRLKAARVLVVGAGGLGSPILMYLAAAGVGTIGVIDDDTVSLSNLQRQIVHDTASIGVAKVVSAASTLNRINPHVVIEPINARLSADNALEIIARYDLVTDGSDNFATRYLVSDACCLAKTPLVFAAVGPFDGHITTLKPYLASPSGAPYPTYRCIFPEAPPAGSVPNCAEVGVMGATVGVLGTLAAAEILKELLGIGDSLAGRLLLYDGLGGRFESVSIGHDPDNPLTGTNAWMTDLSHHRESVA
jgi:molybdopterin-synthase adenylyltransferase